MFNTYICMCAGRADEIGVCCLAAADGKMLKECDLDWMRKKRWYSGMSVRYYFVTIFVIIERL